MTTLIRSKAGRIVVVAPCAGRVAFRPPAALAGELEVYDHGDVLAVVSGSSGTGELAAPCDGFVLRHLVDPGTAVDEGTPLLIMCEA
jgi:hypothetical protein